MSNHITKDTLFDKLPEEIQHQRRELLIQETAQNMIKGIVKACTDAGMADVLPSDFATQTLGELAIMAARNNIKIKAVYGDPKKEIDDSLVPRYC